MRLQAMCQCLYEMRPARTSSGGGYAVAASPERSVADADAVFRSLQANFLNQLGGREPIARHVTDLGPEGTYYQASCQASTGT